MNQSKSKSMKANSSEFREELLSALFEPEDLILTLIDPKVMGNAEVKGKVGEG